MLGYDSQSIEKLWSENAIKAQFENRFKYHVFDGASYFFKGDLSQYRIGYAPTFEGILHSRTRTAGVVDKIMKIDGTAFQISDSGGTRSQRKKWTVNFSDTNAVIFVVSLSEYDQMLFETDDTNRLHDSLHTFKLLCNREELKSVPLFILFNVSTRYTNANML